ncbi:MAG: TetR/AcrR family transcriptional regulator [Candidatus Berkiellales bacterium]
MPRARRNDKRERLVQAADKLIYEQTFHTTTLADIAKLADVPLGNVYYYFKTKEAIMDAVLQKRANEWRGLFQEWEQIPDIKQRLKALLDYNATQSETFARFGCVIGSLCQELGKQGGILANAAAKLMGDILKWTEAQFVEMGKGERASQLATYFLSGIQGMNLLTLTFKEPQFMTRQSQCLKDWLATV